MITNIVLAVGLLAMALLLWLIFVQRKLNLVSASAILATLLLGMLLTRQMMQDRGVLSLNQGAQELAYVYKGELTAYRTDALEYFDTHLETVYDNGATILCAKLFVLPRRPGRRRLGPEVASLLTPPEALADVRSHRGYLRSQLATGVGGSAMPYFSYYTR